MEAAAVVVVLAELVLYLNRKHYMMNKIRKNNCLFSYKKM
jgi:hypothetical protein